MLAWVILFDRSMTVIIGAGGLAPGSVLNSQLPTEIHAP